MNNKQYLTGTKDEKASEALDRFEAFLTDYFEGDIEHDFKISSSKVTEESLLKVESEFNFVFPPSYKEFVLEKGIILIGEEGINVMPLESIRTLYSALKYEWEETFKMVEKDSRHHIENSKELITFSYGEDEQMNWYYCFDKRSVNPTTGEMNIYSFSQDYWFFKAVDECKGRCFDRHFIELINEKIKYIIDEY